MRPMYIKVRHEFFDKENSLCLRKKDELLEVDEKRGKQLMALHMADEAEAPEKALKKK
jgi:hypothetical protein